MKYIELEFNEINRGLVSQFIRFQKTTQVWREIDNKWCIIDDSE